MILTHRRNNEAYLENEGREQRGNLTEVAEEELGFGAAEKSSDLSRKDEAEVEKQA